MDDKVINDSIGSIIHEKEIFMSSKTKQLKIYILLNIQC